ncbi:MAG: branched-chain amino acid ABC transporter permease [Cyclobacteriaceae bacterium]|nr:branched-chain amino acid ABC transporter permease [Cyclobacteriaceae bacterium]
MIGQLLINSIVAGSIYALLALSMSIIYKASEIPNFSQGEKAMFSTYIMFVLLQSFGFPFLLALTGTLVFAFILGVLLEFVFIRRAKEPNLLGYIIITLGFQMILYGLAGWKWGSDQRTFSLPFSESEIIVKSSTFVLTEHNLASIVMAILVMIGLYVLLNHTKLGLAMKATQQNVKAARFNGIPTNMIMGISFGISSVVGTVAGVLVAPISTLDPTMMWDPLIKGFAAAVLGSMKSLPGVVFGGFLLGLIENLFGFYISLEFKSIVAFAIIMLVLFIKPEGLFGKHYIRKV